MDLLQRSVAEYEKEFEMLEKYQITDPQDPDFGGYYNKDFGVVAAELRLGRGKTDDAVFLPSEPVLQRPPRTGLRRRPGAASSKPPAPRRHDGLLFLQFSLCAGHRVCHTGAGKARKLVKAETPEEKAFQKKLFLVLRRMGDGMVEEGFHTPNHRWVISAALALLNTLMPDERYVARIDQYLAEHIDCNEDGEYAERSAGGYNEINNQRVADFGAGSGKNRAAGICAPQSGNDARLLSHGFFYLHRELPSAGQGHRTLRGKICLPIPVVRPCTA